MKLLIDVGNSRLKWALWDGMQLCEANALAHAGDMQEMDFVHLWKKIENVDSVWMSCVASVQTEERLAHALREQFGDSPHIVRTPAFACGVRNAYPQAARLGSDRFLGMVAVHASVVGPSVLVSCGTALTLDTLASDGSHLGGLIVPSPDLMSSALMGGTARLRELNSTSVVDFADNTADAVASGTWLASVALVERFMLSSAARFGTRPTLIVSGGGAPALAALLALPHRIVPDIVLLGLAIYADRMATANP